MQAFVQQEGSLRGSICIHEVSLVGHVTPQRSLIGRVTIGSSFTPDVEEKFITPTRDVQEIFPSPGMLISKVIVDKIPNNYGYITYNGYELTVS